MADYFRLAALLIRVGAAYCVGLGIMGLIWAALAAARAGLGPDPIERLGISSCWIAAGVVVFLISKPVARVLAHGLDS